ncbi:MAG: sigma-70 family RNA polymerase sigma factor [Clostridia bacterium]
MQEIDDVYEEYHELIHAFLLRLCRNEHLADEMTQETFFRALKQWSHFRGDSSVSTWLCTIAKHLYYDTMRKKNPVSLETVKEKTVSDIAENFVRKDQFMTAQHLLHNLSEPYREVFTLRTFCDMTHAQIGELFGKSDSWARSTYFRARKLLSDLMKEDDTIES